MALAASVMTGFVAVQHVFFGLLEMVFWDKPLGAKVFRRPLEEQKQSAALASNQGLYNLFLVAGLAWSFFAADPRPLRLFFLGCVVVAGIWGGITVTPRITVLQGVPAAIGFALVYFGS